MSTGTGVNVSKAVGYALLEPQAGESISKAVAYVLLENPPGLGVSKTVAYVLLEAINTYPPVWPDITFANGMVGLPFSQQWDMPSSGAPITYTLQSGTLPPGLSLTSPGSTAGILSGTPTTAGLYTFTLLASNTYGTASATFTQTITLPSGNYGFVF